MNRFVRYSRRRGTILLLLALLTTGCLRRKGELSGQVSYQGKPLTSGSVVVVGEDNMPLRAAIGADGRYTVVGVPIGEVRVAVHSPNPSRRVSAKDPKQKRPPRPGVRPVPPPEPPPPPGWFPIPTRYGDLDKSELRTTVKAGPNSYDIPLP
jgi:hypothetical protein